MNLNHPMLTIFILQDTLYSGPIRYILDVMNVCLELDIVFVHRKEEAMFVFDHTDKRSIKINQLFYQNLLVDKKYNFKNYFERSPIIFFPESTKEDWLSSAFYIINCFQEYESSDVDQFGRFKYKSSFQYMFDIIEENLVQKYFVIFCEEELNIKLDIKKLKPTKVFLSHDIDSVNGSFLQDGLWAVKNKRFDIVLKLVLEHILNKPHWKNIDKIQEIHTENDLKSTFFWLATKEIGEHQVKNGDYNIKELEELSKYSSINGLHKSSLNLNINEEIKWLPFQTTLNRYHFLMFQLPQAWDKIKESSLNFDASLGFAERYGFRNNYSLPFRPYDISKGQATQFIEVPLNIMDGTFQKYMNIPVKDTALVITDFLEKHKYNSIISILWHNTFFTNYKYKGYLDEYKKIITYLLESSIGSVTPQELIEQYGPSRN